GSRLVGEDAPLRPRAPAALLGEGDQRVPRLPDPAVRELEDRLPGRFRERAPELVGGRVAFAMPPHVEADALAELLLAEIPLDHAEDGAALLVGDGVEALAGFLGV